MSSLTTFNSTFERLPEPEDVETVDYRKMKRHRAIAILGEFN